MRYPLEGTVVLSLAETYPGPYATLLLADLGADVILIERPGAGHWARRAPSFFAALNRNKRSISLDLKSAEGTTEFLKLAERADVVIESYRPGVMKRLGLSFDELIKVNPRLIYVSLSSYGQDGPYRARPGHDLSCQGISGVLSRQASAAETNLQPDVALSDLASGTFAALAVTTGLIARISTGQGTHVDLSMTDSLVSWMTAPLVSLMNGDDRRDGVEIGAGYGAFKCADGKMLTLSIAREDHFWHRLCKALNLDDLADLGHRDRVDRAPELRNRLSDIFAQKPRSAWAGMLDQADIPWGPMHDLAGVLEDPQLKTRRMFVQIQQNGDTQWHVNQPIKFSNLETGIRRPTPGLGEHTAEILDEFGISRSP